MENKTIYKVILTGTDPETKKGGIGFALPGYISALEKANIEYESIPTYRPNSFFGKHILFLVMLPKIIFTIVNSKMQEKTCIVYSHAGANISLFREAVITSISRMFGAKTVMQIHSPETIDYLKGTITNKLFKFCLLGVQTIFVLTPWWKKSYLTPPSSSPTSPTNLTYIDF